MPAPGQPGGGGAERDGKSTGLTTVDPWLAGELRLAQRQGLLTGRHLSLVQHKATTILDWIDQIEKAKSSVEREELQLKAAMVASADPRWSVESLFKPYFQASTDVETIDSEDLDVETEQGKLGVDYSEVEFKGSEAIDEYNELMRQLSQVSTGSVTGDEMASADDGGGWI